MVKSKKMLQALKMDAPHLNDSVLTTDVLRGQLEPLKIVLSVKVVQQSCQAHQELQESVLIVLIPQVFAEIERIY